MAYAAAAVSLALVSSPATTQTDAVPPVRLFLRAVVTESTAFLPGSPETVVPKFHKL